MNGFVLLSFSSFVYFTCQILDEGLCDAAGSFHREKILTYAVFKDHLFHDLDVPPVETAIVETERMCLLSAEGNKAYPLKLGSDVLPVYCHMTDDLGPCKSGGWTLVMKIDGSKIGQQINFIVINKQASSLYSLIADGQYRATSLGRNTWKTLIGPEASLQLYCNKEGFNAACPSSGSMTRIGIKGNNENDCVGCDSRIGFGTGGYPDNSTTCGNTARHWGDNGD
ncbi:hypothetical protein ACROYT_G041302 [Oculina patagonica]